VADVNGDGHNDVIVARGSWESRVMVVLGGPSDSWCEASGRCYTLDQSLGTSRLSVAAGDVNGDGRNDVVVLDAALRQGRLYLQDQDGNLPPLPTEGIQLGAESSPVAVVMGDTGADGSREVYFLAGAGASGEILICRWQTDRFLPVEYTVLDGPPSLAATADVTGDRQSELIVAMESPPRILIFGQGLDGRLELLHPALPLPAPATSLAVADVNADGRGDLLAAPEIAQCLTGRLVLYLQGDSAFREAMYVHDVPFRAAPFAVVAGDVNGDGRGDVAVSNWGIGTISFFTAR
jgi:hypothetical protein